MALVDQLIATFGKPALRFTHADESAVTLIDAEGNESQNPVAAIQYDERWETEYTDRGERRVRVSGWSIPASLISLVQLRGRIKPVSSGETWNIRAVVSKDQHWVHVECVLIAAHELTRPKLRG